MGHIRYLKDSPPMAIRAIEEDSWLLYIKSELAVNSPRVHRWIAK
jgi:hypothetical protein